MFFFPFFWIWLDLRIKGASMKKKNLYFFVLFWLWHLIVVDAAVKLVIERAEMNTLQLSKPYTPTGSPSSKYKHRRASTLLHNIRNIRICMEKKTPIVFVTYENQRISTKNSLPYIKCVTSLLCGPWADLWPFYGLYCKRFSLYIELYTAIAAHARSYQ